MLFFFGKKEVFLVHPIALPGNTVVGKDSLLAAAPFLRSFMTSKENNPTFQGSWLALQVAGGTFAALLVLVLAVALGSRFFGQQGPPRLPSSLLQLPPVQSSLQFLRGQNPGVGNDLVSSSSTSGGTSIPPPPPSSILYTHDDELPAAYNPSKPQVAWN